MTPTHNTASDYRPGRVAWEDTYSDHYPDGIPALVLRHPGRDMGGDYPEPLMDQQTARRVTRILSDPGFVAYAWFGDTLVEYRNGYTTGDESVEIVGPDQDGLYAIGHGLLWEVITPDPPRLVDLPGGNYYRPTAAVDD